MTYGPYEDLAVEITEGVAHFRIQRPEKLNAYRTQTRDEIFDLARRLQADDDVRAVVCSAEGRGFCTGADLSAGRGGIRQHELARAERMSRMGQNAWTTLMPGLDKPTIAAINGIAAGGGMAWACSFDMRILGPEARFITAFARRAFTPDNGLSYFLPRLVGEARAYELLFTARDVHAAEAYRIGLGNELVDDPLTRSLELARELAQGAPLSLLWSKRMVQFAASHTLAEVIEYERGAAAHTRDSSDRREGVRAFLEKRTPQFTGA